MKKLLPFLAYAILILIVFWGVLLPPEGKILFGPDSTRYHYFQRQFLGSALREGSVPWWNPFTMMGVPYLEHPQIPVWYLPNLLFVLLPTNIAMSWYIALHLFIAMSGMYVLLTKVKGNRQTVNGNVSFFPFSFFLLPFSLPAWASGVAFGLSAYFVARVPAGHIDIIAASSWMPWVVWGAISYQLSATSRKKWFIISSVCIAIQLLAGHPMVAVFTLEAVLMITVIHAILTFTSASTLTTGFARVARVTFASGLAVLTGLALSAIQILPNAQFIGHSIRTFPFPDSWAQLGTPTIGHMLEFIDPQYFYSRLPDSGFGFEHVGYIGKIPLLFAMIAIASWMVAKKKRWEVPALVMVSIFGLWMWLGNNAPFDLFSWVRSWMPLYSQIRIPARHIILFVFSASVLFGLGLNVIQSKAIQIIATVLLLVELVPFARHHLSLVPTPDKAEDSELISILTSDHSLYRFLPDFYHGDPMRDVMEFNAPIVHKIQSISGYDTPPLRDMYEFLLAVNGYDFSEVLSYSESTPPFRALTSPYLNFLNVKYILVPLASDPMKNIRSGQFLLVGESEVRGWRLYENKNVTPRFFIATNVQKESNREAVLSAIKQGSVDPKTTEIVDGSTVDSSEFRLDCPAGYQGTISETAYEYGRIVLHSSNPCNAILATSEVMYPGWTATIDGKSVPVFEGNAAFRTVYLPKGTHTIIFSYRPMIVLFGAGISGISLLTVVSILLYTRKKVVR